MKKIIIMFAIVVAGSIAWYLIAPAFIVEELNEASPLSATADSTTSLTTAQPETNEPAPTPVAEEIEVAPAAPTTVVTAAFTPSAHDVAGRALVIQDGAERILRFEDFETINGPDLHIYLATGTDAKDYVDLGKIRATKGNVNYDIPEGTDLNRYDTVLVWCEPFRVLFSYAELNN